MFSTIVGIKTKIDFDMNTEDLWNKSVSWITNGVENTCMSHLQKIEISTHKIGV